MILSNQVGIESDAHTLSLNIPVANPDIAGVYDIALLQLLLLRMAETKGLEPGQFRNTAKVTTME